MRKLAPLLLLFASAVAVAEDRCLVVGVSDGDTLTVRCGAAGAFQIAKVRLAEVDAPEKGQPYGQRAKASLALLCFGAVAEIKGEKTDRYGRTVARVNCRGADASAEQARHGMAWAYTAYLRSKSIEDLETAARAERAGLWADRAPTPPWGLAAGEA